MNSLKKFWSELGPWGRPLSPLLAIWYVMMIPAFLVTVVGLAILYAPIFIISQIIQLIADDAEEARLGRES